jgi:hypothetical protein
VIGRGAGTIYEIANLRCYFGQGGKSLGAPGEQVSEKRVSCGNLLSHRDSTEARYY